jgi:hypothetical protein
VISLRRLLQSLPIVAAALLLSAQPLDTRSPAQHDLVVQNGEGIAPLQGDFVTRKRRYAASIEEYFAIDDDSEQHVNSLTRTRSPSLARSLEVAEPQVVSAYREWRPGRRPDAALPTGPPST